jgi:hypothetical protein
MAGAVSNPSYAPERLDHLGIEPLGYLDFPTDFRHDPQMIQVLHDDCERHLAAPLG